MINKNSLLIITLLISLLLGACGRSGAPDMPVTPETQTLNDPDLSPSLKKEVLIAYDSEPSSEFGKLGLAYAIVLRNLIGHFDLAVELVEVDSYVPGSLNDYRATFYLGSFFDNKIPREFLRDAVASKNTLVWFKYNLWALTDETELGFVAKHGFRSGSVKGFNVPPSSEVQEPGFFDKITYKSKDFIKHYQYDAETGKGIADPDLGTIIIENPAKLRTWVSITNQKTAEQNPYIVQSDNFWYVGDIPFSFMGPRDRYLVLADMLHDMLDVAHEESHHALVRLEDVNAKTPTKSLLALTDHLAEKNIPFSIAVIPRYLDPLGVSNNGEAEDIMFSEATSLINTLKYMTENGGSIVMHGYTHQYGNIRNPENALSGTDYEFWNVVDNQLIDGETQQSLLEVLDQGLTDLTASGFAPYAWTTPHYQASPLAYKTFPERFDATYQRVVYYTADNPDLHSAEAGKDFAIGQFFPYLIHEDYYGQRVIPENIGNIQVHLDIKVNNSYSEDCDDLLENARYASVVRDGVASFFFHPFLLDGSEDDAGLETFKCLTDGISDLGFSWIGGSEYINSSVLAPTSAAAQLTGNSRQ